MQFCLMAAITTKVQVAPQYWSHSTGLTTSFLGRCAPSESIPSVLRRASGCVQTVLTSPPISFIPGCGRLPSPCGKRGAGRKRCTLRLGQSTHDCSRRSAATTLRTHRCAEMPSVLASQQWVILGCAFLASGPPRHGGAVSKVRVSSELAALKASGTPQPTSQDWSSLRRSLWSNSRPSASWHGGSRHAQSRQRADQRCPGLTSRLAGSHWERDGALTLGPVLSTM
jgi:hypothetical protein